MRRTAVTRFGRSVELGSRYDPRAFTFLPERRLALVAVERYGRQRSSARLVALRIGPAGELTRAGSWPLGRSGAWSARALPLTDGRVALVHHSVRIVRVP